MNAEAIIRRNLRSRQTPIGPLSPASHVDPDGLVERSEYPRTIQRPDASTVDPLNRANAAQIGLSNQATRNAVGRNTRTSPAGAPERGSIGY